MIVIFPLLVDENISENIIPGVCKALEKFVLIYEMASVVKSTGLKILKIGSEVASTGIAIGSAIAKTKDSINEQSQYGGGTKQTNPVMNFHLHQAQKSDTQKIEDRASNILNTLKTIKDLATTRIDLPNEQNLSVEPTWVNITTPSGSKILGIKVLPFPVKSKYPLSAILSAEASLNFFYKLIFKYERKVIRMFWALCRALRVPFLKGRAITGNPIQDIVFASTTHGKDIFCLLNYSDIKKEDFFRSAGATKSLFEMMGWNSLIFADDINKKIIFCMKQFKGLCSTVQYHFIYSSLGKDHGRVFEKLEDIKKASSPFFKVSISGKKILGENTKVSNYLNKIK